MYFKAAFSHRWTHIPHSWWSITGILSIDEDSDTQGIKQKKKKPLAGVAASHTAGEWISQQRIWPSWTLRCSSVCWVEMSALLSPSGEEVPHAAPWRGSHHQAADGPLVLAAARAGATAWSHLQIWGWQTWPMQPTGFQPSYHSVRQFRQIMIEEDEQKIANAMFFFSFGFQIVVFFVAVLFYFI